MRSHVLSILVASASALSLFGCASASDEDRGTTSASAPTLESGGLNVARAACPEIPFEDTYAGVCGATGGGCSYTFDSSTGSGGSVASTYAIDSNGCAHLWQWFGGCQSASVSTICN